MVDRIRCVRGVLLLAAAVSVFFECSAMGAQAKKPLPAWKKVMVTPAIAINLVPGSSDSMTLTATQDNGFAGTVTVSGLPAGVTAEPMKFELADGASQKVTLTAAASGLAMGNSVVTLESSSKHKVRVVVNLGTQVQDFVLASPTALSVSPGGSTNVGVEASAIGGYGSGEGVTVKLTGLPAGVTANKLTQTATMGPQERSTAWFVLTGAPGLANGTTEFTVTGTAGKLTHENKVVITTAPTNAVSATVKVDSPGTVFPAHFIGFSAPFQSLELLTGKGPTTAPSFLRLLANFAPYVGSPSIRTMLPSGPTATEGMNVLHALSTGATFTVKGVTTSPQFFVTTPNEDTPPTQVAHEVEAVIKAVGSENLLGIELDNEPEGYVSKKFRPAGWSLPDYLAQVAGYQQALTPLVTGPKFIATATGNNWDYATPAAMTQLKGQLSTYTEHLYAQTACNGNVPKLETVLNDKYAHEYYAHFAGIVKTLGSVPVRVGEFNSVSCEGYAGVSNSFAASLWLVDVAFETKSAGASGFNMHSNGMPLPRGAKPYDVAYNNDGAMSVFAPFYGLLFFAEAIQNGAKPLPVVMTQTSGNVKVWATVDKANTVRVVVIEKDMDGLSNSKVVKLNLGSYKKAGTVTTMTAPAVTATSGITIAGQTFDGTTNGTLTGTAASSTMSGVGGVYTVTVQDGTATLLTVPQ